MIISGWGGFSWALYATIDVYYHAATVGLNPLQLVLVGTTLEVTVLLAETPTGILADLFSRRLSIIIGHFLFGIGVLIEGAFPAFEPILLGTVLWGMGVCFISGAKEAWITDELAAEGERELQPVFLRGTQWEKLGELAAVPMSILLATVAIQIPIFFCGITQLLLALMVTLSMPERGFQPARPGERKPFRQLRAGVSLVRARNILVLIMGVTLFYGMYSEGFDRLWTKHLLDHFTLPTIGALPIIVWWGVLRGVSSTLAIILAEITRRRQEIASGQRGIWLLLAITVGISFGLAFYANIRWLGLAMLAYIYIEALRILYVPLFFAWINGFIHSEVRATVISLVSQLDAVGQIAGGPIIGYVGLRWSTRWAMSCSALLLLPAVWIYSRIGRQQEVSAHEV